MGHRKYSMNVCLQQFLPELQQTKKKKYENNRKRQFLNVTILFRTGNETMRKIENRLID